MIADKSTRHSAVVPSDPQQANREWWESNPMTYDWEKTLQIERGTLKWYDEIDRRFLDSAYYSAGQNGQPFGRFLKPDLVSGKQVLEIGCGMGTHAEMLLRNGACLTAVDQTALAVELTRRRLELKQLDARVLQQDAEKLTFPDRSFDVVWTWGVIHHSSSTEQCVSEISRVLRPGGRLMMMVYYRRSLVFYLHCGFIRGVLFGQLLRQSLQQIYVDATDGFYARVFSKSELGALLARHFHSLQITVVGLKAELYPIPRNHLKIALERVTPDWLARTILGKFGSMVVAEAIRS
jgi:2-polyprenyl-3-methyl-5-hydroxy-6-metoxy-1,4-benzoquinol methylase